MKSEQNEKKFRKTIMYRVLYKYWYEYCGYELKGHSVLINSTRSKIWYVLSVWKSDTTDESVPKYPQARLILNPSLSHNKYSASWRNTVRLYCIQYIRILISKYRSLRWYQFFWNFHWQHGKGSFSSWSILLGTHGELLTVVFSPFLGLLTKITPFRPGK